MNGFGFHKRGTGKNHCTLLPIDVTNNHNFVDVHYSAPFSPEQVVGIHSV
jgi:hypothetical protein